MKRAPRNALPHAVLALYIGIILLPMGWVLLSSFKTNKEIITSPWSWPNEWLISNYWNAWTGAHVSQYFTNSLVISIISAAMTLLLGTATSFALTRMTFPRLSKAIRRVLMLALLVPAGSLLVPLYMLLRSLHLYNTPMALILPYITVGLPLTVFMVNAIFKSIPSELEDAGIMDGLSIYGLLGRVLVPTTAPMLLPVFMLNFLSSWNEFMMANLFQSKERLRTLPVSMVAFYDQLNMNYGSLCAAIMFSLVPVVLIYLFLQKRMIESVKA
ncbi:carbohydrate ABC transporter permease [Paenibacillus sp. GCM10023248]|uniref:carbohydrate ABC transporter permease n=1 Tax=unclassified Paenibacillus TaxID=185978 RepID=UPI0023797B9F|nr:carbohydrate ABC transporter permease [Paenibacillus sp. MAHUQ-63]MDD9269769.1 carbohydrate ABC transporter permease [Paenibacillus sp. MAHUQ-63]